MPQEPLAKRPRSESQMAQKRQGDRVGQRVNRAENKLRMQKIERGIAETERRLRNIERDISCLRDGLEQVLSQLSRGHAEPPQTQNVPITPGIPPVSRLPNS